MKGKVNQSRKEAKMKAFVKITECHKPYQASVMKVEIRRYDADKPKRNATYEQVSQSSLDRIVVALGKPVVEMTTDGFIATYYIR